MQKSLPFSLFLVTEILTVSLLAQNRPSQQPNVSFCIVDDASYPHFFFSNCRTLNAKSTPSITYALTGLYSWQLKEGEQHELTGTPFQEYTLISPTPYIGKKITQRTSKIFLITQVKTNRGFFGWDSLNFIRIMNMVLVRNLVIDKVSMYWSDNDVVRTDMLDYAFEIEYLDKHLAA